MAPGGVKAARHKWHRGGQGCDPATQGLTKHSQQKETTPKHDSVTNRDPTTSVIIRTTRIFDLDHNLDGRRDGRRGPHTFVWPPLATLVSSYRAHAASLARTHARNANANEAEIDFPVMGAC